MYEDTILSNHKKGFLEHVECVFLTCGTHIHHGSLMLQTTKQVTAQHWLNMILYSSSFLA